MAKNKHVDLFKDIIPCVDQGIKELWDAATEEGRKEIKGDLWNLNRYISSVATTDREIQEHYLLTVNQYYNKNWANVSQHPKLQWLTLASCSHESKAKQFHEWIALKKEKNKKEEFLADLFPTMKRADLATLAVITTDREIKDYCQNLGWDKKKKSMQLNFKCEHCEKLFAKEKTLVVHVCEQKRRHLSRNEKHVLMGLLTFQRFYQLTQKAQQPKTFEEFAASSFYTAFVKFGSFLVNTAPIYPERFVDYVVKSGVKLDHWCRDELYQNYIAELIKVEPADGAIQRSIMTMMSWGESNSAAWEHYFAYVNLNRATHDIKEGLVSPWMILNARSGKEMLTRMNDEQLEIVGPVIDPQFWLRRFKTLPADVELVKDVIKEAKIL